jgi:putative transposase
MYRNVSLNLNLEYPELPYIYYLVQVAFNTDLTPGKQIVDLLIKRLQRSRNRDKNKRREMHHKISNYLCSNFKHIIIPDYGVKNMSVQSSINRSMRNLGFYQFLTFLKHKCVERDVKLYIVNESYTSRACSNCGCLNKPNDREYKCKECNIEIHRDVNGAVNIALKHLKSK